MKLHAGTYLWPEYMEDIPKYPALDGNIHCDCLIIGGGIGGALCAYLLTLQVLNTILVEKNAVASGSSMVNTGLLQYTSDKILTSFIHTFGEKASVHFYKLCYQALQKLKEIGGHLHRHYAGLPQESYRNLLVYQNLIVERPTIFLASSPATIPKL